MITKQVIIIDLGETDKIDVVLIKKKVWTKMKQKTPKKTIEKRIRAAKAVINGIIDDKLSLPGNVLVTDDSCYSIMTKKRSELVRTINQHNPSSMQELANIVKRTKQAVYRDLKMLKNYGIIELKKIKKNVKPIVKCAIVVVNLLEPKNNSKSITIDTHQKISSGVKI